MNLRESAGTKESSQIMALRDAIRVRTGLTCEFQQVEDVVAEIASIRGTSFNAVLDVLKSRSAGSEWELLLNRVTIPETFFFRLEEHWDALRTTIVPRFRDLGRPLRVWSAACATGEEPYSLAMTFRRMGIDAKIYATDLVEKYLSFAKAGVYSTRALRGRVFDEIAQDAVVSGPTIAIKEALKEKVSFSQLNLLDAPGMQNHTALNGPFDIVFCRNVLIYFSPENCAHIVRSLAQSMQPNGYLFFGAAEFPGLWTKELSPELIGKVYVWRRADLNSGQVEKHSGSQQQASLRSVPITTSIVECQSVQLNSFDEIFRLLQGSEDKNLSEIVGTTRLLVDQNELDPRAHIALGLALELLEDHAKAIESYAQAIFLDKDNAFAHWRQSVLYSVQREPARAVRSVKWAKNLVTTGKGAIFCPPGMSPRELESAIDETARWLTT